MEEGCRLSDQPRSTKTPGAWTNLNKHMHHAPPNLCQQAVNFTPPHCLLQAQHEMSLSGLALLLLAAKAGAQRPSLRQPQGLTTDDWVAASRARTSTDPALVERFQQPPPPYLLTQTQTLTLTLTLSLTLTLTLILTLTQP